MVRGSKRTQQQAQWLVTEGIAGFRLDLDELDWLSPQAKLITESMLESDCLVVNIPPGFRQDPDAYLRRLIRLRECVSPFQYQRIVFISSTGVYPVNNQVVTEEDAKVHSIVSERLLAAEQVFSDVAPTCVLRFAGLVGPKRHPGRFLSGKSDITGGAAPVNLVHLDDCVKAVTCIILADNVQNVYNLCAQEHPSRQALYQAASIDLGLTLPVFNQIEQVGKRVDGGLITRDLGFAYQFNDPLDMLSHC